MEIAFKLLLIAADSVMLLGSIAEENEKDRKRYLFGFLVALVLTFLSFMYLR